MQISDGQLAIPSQSGSGFTFNQNAIKDFAFKH